MPRRKNTDGAEGAPPPKPRVRKKKEVVNLGPGGANTPSIDPMSMKMEPGTNPMTGFDLNHPGLGGPANGGGPPMHMSMGGPMEDGPMPPYGAQPEYFYHHPGGMLPPGHPAAGPPGHPGGPPGHPGMGAYGMPGHPPGHHGQMPNQIPPQQQFVEPEPPMSGAPPFMFASNGPPHGPPPGQGPGSGPPQFMIRHMPHQPTMPQPPFLEFRLQEMNRRLYSFHNSQYTLNQADHAQWWEAFAHEFFDDDAKMTIALFDITEMVPRKYTIGRLLIPRFYRKIFDNGVREMFYVVRTPAQERINPQQWGMCALDCENVLMVTRHDRPVPAEVHTECRLFVEFSPFEDSVGYRIRHWAIELRTSQEFYRMPKDGNVENSPEFVKSGFTRSGLPQEALHYLKMCLILEPMQIIMHHSKATSAPPQQTLRTILFNQRRTQQQQHTPLPGGMLNEPSLSVPCTPTEEPGTKKPPRKRTRKTTTNSTANNTNASPKKKGGAAAAAATNNNIQSPPPPQNMQPNFVPNPNAFNQMMQYQQDVLVVGEPSMMGCEFGEDDERAISRIENSQYDPNSQGGMPNHHNQSLSSTSMAQAAAPQQLHCTSTAGPMMGRPSQLLGGNSLQGGLPTMTTAQMFMTDFGEMQQQQQQQQQQQSSTSSLPWPAGSMAGTTNS